MRSNPSCGKFDGKIILFMDTRFIKIPLAAASLAYAIHLFTVGQVGAGVGMVLVAALLVLITLQSMRLLMAFISLRQQKMEDARKWLDRVNPKHLWPRRRGYWYFLSGSLMMEHNMNEAERLLKEALEIGLKQDHDKAAVKLNLAVVASAKRKTKLAKALLNECKRLDAKGVLKKDIKQVEAAIRSPQQMRMRGR
tara:strand:- start:1487 stop:2071 length:585 start_codon:yes stop_codon:yes gene_type:complete